MHGILWRFLPCAVNALTCGYNYLKPYCVSYPLIDWLCMAELTKEQIACEEKFLEGIPRWNIGALFLPLFGVRLMAFGLPSCSILCGWLR